MNSEIEYENFIKNIDLVIYDKIDIDNWNISIDLIFERVPTKITRRIKNNYY